MDALLQHLRAWWGAEELGEVPNHPDPAEPDDLGEPLSQEQIDFLKKLKKEIEQRFEAGPFPPPDTTPSFLDDLTLTTGGPGTNDPANSATSVTLPAVYEGKRIRVLRNDTFFRSWTRTASGFNINGGFALEKDETLTIQHY